MQDDIIVNLVEYLADKPFFERVEFVDNREYGPNDFAKSAYVRSDGDRDGRDYYRDGDYVVGRYVLVGEAEKECLLSLINALCVFTKGMIQWEDASTNSEVIYRNETDQNLTDDCSYVMVRFELRTIYDCTALC